MLPLLFPAWLATASVAIDPAAPSWVPSVAGVASRAAGLPLPAPAPAVQNCGGIPCVPGALLLTGGGHVDRRGACDRVAGLHTGEGWATVMLPDDDEIPYGPDDGYGLRTLLLLHEYGHLAGLPDTYRDRQIMTWHLGGLGGGLYGWGSTDTSSLETP